MSLARSLALVLATLVAVMIGGSASTAAEHTAPATDVLSIDVVDSAPAGEDVPVTIEGAIDGTPVRLVAIGSLGQLVLNAVAGPTGTSFVLPTEVTRSAGTITLLASSGRSRADAAILISSGEAVGPVQAVVGARSIVADGADSSMVVAIPVDSWGNAIAEGSEVQISRESTTGVVTTAGATVSHLVAWLDLASGTLAGRGTVWVSAGNANGQAVSLDEVAGPPLPFTLEPANPILASNTGADGQSLVSVRTSVLRDRFGNLMPDGTQVTLSWTGPTGNATATTATIAGVAAISIQAPALPGTLVFEGFSRGVKSQSTLTLPFANVVADFEVTASVVDSGLEIGIGPVNRSGATFVPDGTTVSVTVVDQANSTATGVSRLTNGVTSLIVPTEPLVGSVTVSVTVLGMTVSETLQ